jgi:hypothetical protein
MGTFYTLSTLMDVINWKNLIFFNQIHLINNNIMRKFNQFLALFIFSLFLFTSCQKEKTSEQLNATEVAAETENAPTPILEKVAGEVESFSDEIATKLIKDQPEVIFDEDAAQSRSSEDEIRIESIAAQTKVQLFCGTSHVSSNDHYYNSFTNYFYASRGYRADLNGGDNVYYFDATDDMLATFKTTTFSSNRQNLAMFLFEGDYDTHNHIAYVRQVMAASSSRSVYREELTNVALKRGRRYILVVDSAPGRGADYRLTVNCISTPSYNCDDFESYYFGNLSPQSPYWSKWDYNSKDGRVAGNSNQYLAMARDPYAGQHAQQDVIYKTGRRYIGSKTLSMNMWIYRGHSGYFNIQKRLRQEYGAEIYFHDSGYGEIIIANRSYNFSYPQNQWMDIEMNFDFSVKKVRFYINGRLIRSWSTKYTANSLYGSNQIEGIDFYVPKSDSEFFVDNICFQ